MDRRVFVSIVLTTLLSSCGVNGQTAAATPDDQERIQQAAHAAVEAAKSRVCPHYEIDPLAEQYCRKVTTYAGLRDLIEESESGDVLSLCPFNVGKVSSSDPPITIKSGITIKCTPTKAEEFCIIRGGGKQVEIQTGGEGGDTIIQGFSFRGADDHAVHILSDDDNDSQLATHTFCQTSFLNNVRDEESRGGALMIDRNVGTVNLYECLFSENWTATYGAAVYSRTKQLNVVDSVFVMNTAKQYGGAIFVASDGALMVESTMFINNRGFESYDVVINSPSAADFFVDGTGNSLRKDSVEGETCYGVFNMETDICTTFLEETEEEERSETSVVAVTTNETISSTNEPTAVQSIKNKTIFPTSAPTIAATASPTAKATVVTPTIVPTQARVPTTFPTVKVAQSSPTTVPTEATTASPTLKETTQPVVSPTGLPTGPTPSPTSRASFQTVISTPSGDVNATVSISFGAPGTAAGANTSDTSVELCKFHENKISNDTSPCLEIDTFEDFALVIAQSKSSSIVFCGGFQIEKKLTERPVAISSAMDVRCQEPCTFNGTGSFIEVSGALTQIRLDNFRFMNNIDTAVRVATGSSLATTTFCNSEFSGNTVPNGVDGGALSVGPQSGSVNIVRSIFKNNFATNGGAISFKGYQLSIFNSSFTVNRASSMGNAIFVDAGSSIVVSGTEFILNSVQSSSTEATLSKPGSGDYAIVVEPQQTGSLRAPNIAGRQIDNGGNAAVLNGLCNGFYIESENVCQEFDM